MRVHKFFGALAAASVALTPIAATAETAGSIVSVKGDAFVSSNGRLVRAQPNMAVNSGDRVITQSGATANVALNNCSVNVAGGQMATVSGTSCGSVQTASFDRGASKTSNASALAGGGFIVAILAAAAVIIGIIIVVKNNDDSPTSP